MPQVSIIVPVHNTEKYLQACVNSLTSQTLTDIEIILVENCSTDNSLALCHKLAESDSRIKVLSIDKADLSTARNEGVKVASGEYCGFVDSDDTIAPEMYEEMYNVAKANDLGLVNCNFLKRYDNRPDKFIAPDNGEVQLFSAKEITTLNLTDKISRVVCTLLIRKDLFNELQFPTYMYHEDRASTHLFMAHSGKAAHINKAYYYYYQRQGSIMHAGSFRRMRDFVLATTLRLEFISNSGLYTTEEIPVVASRCAEQLLRKLRHLLRLAKSEAEQEEAVAWCRKIELIPQGVQLPMKARIIRWYLRKFVI